MGRNKFSQTEIIQIAKLLRLKNAGNRAQQKQVRHELRVNYEFNISDFNEPGRAFGEDELQAALDRGAIQILDDATIANMKAKRARDHARDEAERQRQSVCSRVGGLGKSAEMTAQVLPIVRTVPASITVWTAINRKWGKKWKIKL